VLFPQVRDHHLRFRLLESNHGFPFTEDLEFHLLEVPKFGKSAEELSSGLDLWLYFLRHAEKMDTGALPAALAQEPLLLRAVEELKMLAQTDVERERYEARRKALLDYNTGLKVARLEGEMIGRIHLCEQLLKRPLTPTEQLVNRSLQELTKLADDLQAQVLKE
jgi:hypothetical protein